MFFSSFYIYLLFALAYLCIAWYISPRMPFSTINNLISIISSNFTPAFFKQACHANPSADRNWAGSSSYISIHLIL